MKASIKYLRERVEPLIQKLPEDARAVLLTTLLAVTAAGGAVAFMSVVNVGFETFFLRPEFKDSPGKFLLVSFAVITGASLLTGWLLAAFCPQAAGSGVPQAKSAFWKEFGVVNFREVWVKFVAGAVSIGGGLSLGREGPSVFMGSGLASCLAGSLGISRRARRSALIIGATSALAAAFNTPMAAVAFALEEVIKDFSSRLLGRALLAAMLGALVVHGLIGPQPAFALPEISEPRWRVYPLVVLVGALGALVAAAFQQGSLKLRAYCKGQKRLPGWFLPCLGGWCTWLLGAGVYLATGKVAVFGLGYGDLSEALQSDLVLAVALTFLVTKLLATIACYATGGCGGIFSPSLFLGAMAGFGVAGVFESWWGLNHPEKILLAAVGMCACFGATVRAPWSALLIVFEMTHSFGIIPALLLSTLVSQGLSRVFGSENFYDAILMQDGHSLHVVAPPRTLNDWQDLKLETITNRRPVIVRDWTPEMLRGLLANHPYRLFPALRDGKLGIVSRDALFESLKVNAPAVVQEAAVARPDQAIREISELFIRAPSGMILTVAPATGEVVGLLTLHDILRAQAALQE